MPTVENACGGAAQGGAGQCRQASQKARGGSCKQPDEAGGLGCPGGTRQLHLALAAMQCRQLRAIAHKHTLGAHGHLRAKSSENQNTPDPPPPSSFHLLAASAKLLWRHTISAGATCAAIWRHTPKPQSKHCCGNAMQAVCAPAPCTGKGGGRLPEHRLPVSNGAEGACRNLVVQTKRRQHIASEKSFLMSNTEGAKCSAKM